MRVRASTTVESRGQSQKRVGGGESEHRTQYWKLKKPIAQKETRKDYQRNRMCDCLDVPGESAKEDDKERDNFGEVRWT